MLHTSFHDHNGARWYRVNATQARNAFISGEPVTVCPFKQRPWGYWSPQFTFTRDDDVHAWELEHYGARGLWDRLVNKFIYYNCNNAVGRYPAYFLLDK